MAKVELSPQVLIPARPILIVGALVDGVPNFMEVGGGGSISSEPPLIALPIRPVDGAKVIGKVVMVSHR